MEIDQANLQFIYLRASDLLYEQFGIIAPFDRMTRTTWSLIYFFVEIDQANLYTYVRQTFYMNILELLDRLIECNESWISSNGIIETEIRLYANIVLKN